MVHEISKHRISCLAIAQRALRLAQADQKGERAIALLMSWVGGLHGAVPPVPARDETRYRLDLTELLDDDVMIVLE